MPTVLHPQALDEIVGHTPGKVTVGGVNHEVDDDGTVELPTAAHVRELAGAYGLDSEDLAVDQSETCEVVKQDDEVCGRELPCPYHSE
jgi:hypothetical protein